MICRLCLGSGSLELREAPYRWPCPCCDGDGAKAVDRPKTTKLSSAYRLPDPPKHLLSRTFP